MTGDSSLIQREMADVELRPFTVDEFHRRRHQKQRNRRIGTAVMGLVLAAVVAGGVLGAIGEDDQTVDSDLLGPLPSPFEGSWVAAPVDDLPQSMEIHLVSDGDVHEVVARDSASAGCSGGAATVSGTGHRETDGSGLVTLVISAAMTCDDGREPIPQTPEAEGRLNNFPLSWVHDPVTDELLSSMGVRWWREGTGETAEPVYVPPTLPEPGDQPADPVAAEEQVRAAFTGLFDFSKPREERTQLSERPEVWAAANVELMDGQYASAVQDMYAQVDSVVFTDPAHAAVQFQTIASDPIVPRYHTGAAVLVDGRWVVSITTTCGMVEVAGIRCDMTL